MSSRKAIRRKTSFLSNVIKEDCLNIDNKKDCYVTKESSKSKVRLKITPSKSFTFDNWENFNKTKTKEAKDFLNVPGCNVEDEEDHFYDARSDLNKMDLESLKINYELPADPATRQRWINGLKAFAAGEIMLLNCLCS